MAVRSVILVCIRFSFWGSPEIRVCVSPEDETCSHEVEGEQQLRARNLTSIEYKFIFQPACTDNKANQTILYFKNFFFVSKSWPRTQSLLVFLVNLKRSFADSVKMGNCSEIQASLHV